MSYFCPWNSVFAIMADFELASTNAIVFVKVCTISAGSEGVFLMYAAHVLSRVHAGQESGRAET